MALLLTAEGLRAADVQEPAGEPPGPIAELELSDLDGVIGFKLNGEVVGDQSGLPVSRAGDLNGDGFDDLVVSAAEADPNGNSSGRVYVVFGRAPGVLFPAELELSSLDGTNGFMVNGEDGLDRAGVAVSAAGDINGDDLDDLLIGAYFVSLPGPLPLIGRSYVVFGRAPDNPFPAELELSGLDGTNGFKIRGEAFGDRSGFAVSAGGDINGDGRDDLLIGAITADPDGRTNAGRGHVVFGREPENPFPAELVLSTLDGAIGFKINGEAAGNEAGHAVRAAGDVNGDGVGDVVLGARFAAPNGTNSGRSYVVFGRAPGIPFPAEIELSDLDGATGFKLNGEMAHDHSGWDVSAAGDVNGDGFDDVIVGAHIADPNGLVDAGRSYVVFGRAPGDPFPAEIELADLDGSIGFKLNGEAAGDQSGVSLGVAGDFNDDGRLDLIIGAHTASPNGLFSAGRTYIVFGRDPANPFPAELELSELNGLYGFKINGESAISSSGRAVDGAGDVDGDGIADLLIGAWAAAPNGNLSGRSYVVYGQPPPSGPVLVISPDSLDFGPQQVGTTSSVSSVTLGNVGTADVHVGDVAMPPLPFAAAGGSCGTTPFVIAPGTVCTRSYTFSPIAVGIFDAVVEVVSDAPSSPDSFGLAGEGVPSPPQIQVDPDSLDVTLPQDDATTEILTITNGGGEDLEWEVVEQPDLSGLVDFGDVTTITHSASMDVAPDNNLGCSVDGGASTLDTQFLRTFALDDFDIAHDFEIVEVAFGVQTATAATTVVLNLYTLEGEFTYPNLTLIGSATVDVPVTDLSLRTVPISATVPAGVTLVVEIAAPDLNGVSAFVAGSNALGETAPSYFASTSCGLAQPIPYGSIGLPQVHLVMAVSGIVHAPPSCERPGWLAADPLAGVVAPGGSEPMDVTFNASGLTPGDYEATLCLSSNDPERPLTTVPMALTVTEAEVENDTILVSRASGLDGVKGDGASGPPLFPGDDRNVSADGRHVAFESLASNLHPDDTDIVEDVFVRNAQTHETILVSRASGPDGSKGNSSSTRPSISADGRHVAFASLASNLHPDDTDPLPDILVRDTQTNETVLVSRADGAEGVKGNGPSLNPAISADGRYVAFASLATNLHLDDTDSVMDVFVRDLQTHETILVSRAGGVDGVKGNGNSGLFPPSISADGLYVAFPTQASNLHPDDTDEILDVFVRGLQTHETILVSRAGGADGAKGDNLSGFPSISADGRHVAFVSDATNLHPDDANIFADVFVRDIQTSETILASRANGSDGANGNGGSTFPSISAGGRYVAFASDATNFHPDDFDDVRDVFVRDLQAHETILASRSGAGGVKGNGSSTAPSVSAAGRFVVFASAATNLHPDDTDAIQDVYLGDIAAGATIDVDPDRFTVILDAGSTTEETLTVANLGEIDDLEWAVTQESPEIHGVLLRPAGDGSAPEPAAGRTDGQTPRPPGTADIPALITAERLREDGQLSAPSDSGSVPAFVLSGTETTITHSASFDVVAGVGAACPASSGGNMFLRTFALEDFGIFHELDITEVTFGIEELVGSAPITVNLYTLEGAFLYANLTPIGTATETFDDQEVTLVTVPVSGTAPRGSTLVVEIAVPSVPYFPGANMLGETAPSYVALDAAGLCGPLSEREPTPFADTNFPGRHLVIAVTGQTEPVDCALPDWLTANPASGSVAPGTTQPVTVTFDATGVPEGDHRAFLCLASNDPDTPLVVVPADLTVIGGGGGAELSFDPSSLDFGEVEVGTTGPPLTATLHNTGDGNATGLSFTNPGAGFAADTSGCGTTLPAGESCEISVTFAPVEPGPASATLEATSDQGAGASLNLTGSGLGEPMENDTILVSRASGLDGVKGNSGSFTPSVSADGRYVAFESSATSLHPDDVDDLRDVFVRDLQTHETILVSRASGADAVKGNGPSATQSISADGRYVAFESFATNLHPDDTDAIADVYVRDLQTHETILVSRASGVDGVKGNNLSLVPSISADGRYVAFTSFATNLHPDASDGGVLDVFVRDLQTHETILVSRASGTDGVKGDNQSFTRDGSISADGRYVTFTSLATNLHPDDLDTSEDSFVRDLQTHETILVSRAGGAAGVKGNGDSHNPSISPDGRYVAFTSLASNLHPDDADTVEDVLVRDLQTHETILASRAGGADGAKGNGASEDTSVSGDGRYITFASDAANLHPDDLDDVRDVFVRDLQAHETILASRAGGAGGVKGNDSSTAPSVSADGRYVAFHSGATNLDPDDADGIADVFARDVLGPSGGAEMTFDPSSLDFGEVEVGTTSPPLTAALHNTGDGDATGLSFTDPGAGFAVDTSGCGTTLPTGESCEISVSFTPSDPGPAAAGLEVESVEGASAELSLSGNGVEGDDPVIEVDPDSLSSTLPSGETETQPLTIANVGGGVLEWEVTDEDAGLQRIDGITLESGEFPLQSAVIDPAGDFAYFGTDTGPGRVIKIDLETFERVDAFTLESGEDSLVSAVIDPAGDFAYFGAVTAPGQVVKIDLETFERVDAITLESGEDSLLSAVIDPAGDFAYFGTVTLPGRVVKIDLETFERVDAITLESGEPNLFSAVIDPAGDFAYFGTFTAPGRVVKIDLETFERVEAITLESGEDNLFSAVIDPTGEFAYFGTLTFPGRVVKIDLETFERVEAVELESGEDFLLSAVIAPAGDFAYFGTLTDPGRVVKIGLGGQDCALPDWVSVDPMSGSVFGGNDQVALVAFDASDLEPGDYEATLCLASNDPAQPVTLVPLALTVMPSGAPELAFAPESLDFGEVEVGSTSLPQTATLQNIGSSDATGLTFGPTGSAFEADTGACDDTLPSGASCEVSVTLTPVEPGPTSATLEVTSDQDASAGLSLAGTGVSDGVVTPVALEVDPEALLSDGNEVFEPGELIEVAPAWRNDGLLDESFTGIASSFNGLDGANYLLPLDDADYGNVEPGATASCLDTGVCYWMGVNDPAVRPATHWQAVFDETLSEGTTHTWSLHIGDSFLDVPRTSPFYPAVETLLHHGVTGGCTATEYCPTGTNTRGQMAVFLLKAAESGEYTPPACEAGQELFADVPFDSPLCPWIEELAARQVTSGCGGGNYCPGSPVTRAQMAVFLLKAFEGAGYTPPECAGEFADVACPSTFAAWIEELSERGITGGCSADPPAYCPAAPVTRDQMAVFVTRTFGLVLYGP